MTLVHQDDKASKAHAVNKVQKDPKALTVLEDDPVLLVQLAHKVTLVPMENKVLPALKVKLDLEDRTDKMVIKVLMVLPVPLNQLVSSLPNIAKMLMLLTVQLAPSNSGMVTLCYTPLAITIIMLKILAKPVLVSNGSTLVHLPSVTEMTLADTLAETVNLTG